MNNDITLLGFGSPIVDAVLNYKDDETLCIEIEKRLIFHMTSDFPLDFYNSIFESPNVQTQLGGSAMNSMRIAQAVLNKICDDNSITVGFMGSIGNDIYSKKIEDGLNNEKVRFLKEEIPNEQTSTCLVVAKELDRKFFSHLGTSQRISLEFVKSIENTLTNVKIFYADAYLIGVCYKIFEKIFVENFKNDSLIISLGLACTNIIKNYFENIISLLPFVDILFLNNEELAELQTKFNVSMKNQDFIEYLEDKFDKLNKNKRRIIVNTQSSEPTLVYVTEYDEIKKVTLYTIPAMKVERNMIIDTNGAGDSFTGGYLAGLLTGQSIENCAKLGNFVASKVIQLKGFQVPNIDDINQVIS